jgi:hypothetical protein
MRLYVLLVAGVMLGTVPSLAEEAPPAAGRYQIAPDEDGFVRLDTETGAMSHCVKRQGAWTCDALAEDRVASDARIEGLTRDIDALTRKVDDLTTRLATLEKSRRSEAPSAGAPTNDPELDRALSFAERLMQRFFDMVRELKTEDSSGQRI